MLFFRGDITTRIMFSWKGIVSISVSGIASHGETMQQFNKQKHPVLGNKKIIFEGASYS